MSSDDIDAVNTYISNTNAATPEAQTLKAQWSTWYNNLNFISKTLDSTYEEAAKRRTVFNAANLQPANLQDAADLTADQKVTRQAAIASSPALSPTQKKAALAKNPNVPTTHGVPGSASSHATIRQGSKGSDVVAWQAIIGVKGDGTFGAGTAAATRKWQTSHGLTADGVVGPKTWSAAIGVPVQEAPSGNIASNAQVPFVPAASPPPFQSTASHVAAVASSPKTADVKAKAQSIVASPVSHTALKIAIPAVGLLAGGWFFGPVGLVVGGALGLFGSTKV